MSTNERIERTERTGDKQEVANKHIRGERNGRDLDGKAGTNSSPICSLSSCSMLVESVVSNLTRQVSEHHIPNAVDPHMNSRRSSTVFEATEQE